MNEQKPQIEWRPIPGYEGLYSASSDGFIRSEPRNTTSGKILKGQLNNSGYLRVSVKSKYLYIHHLVAVAFIGVRPVRADVNHIDGNKLNNAADNLEYVSRAENMAHARRLGLHNNYGDGHYNAKLDSDTVWWIRFAHDTEGVDAESMAEVLGISKSTVVSVLQRKNWKGVE